MLPLVRDRNVDPEQAAAVTDAGAGFKHDRGWMTSPAQRRIPAGVPGPWDDLNSPEQAAVIRWHAEHLRHGTFGGQPAGESLQAASGAAAGPLDRRELLRNLGGEPGAERGDPAAAKAPLRRRRQRAGGAPVAGHVTATLLRPSERILRGSAKETADRPAWRASPPR